MGDVIMHFSECKSVTVCVCIFSTSSSSNRGDCSSSSNSSKVANSRSRISNSIASSSSSSDFCSSSIRNGRDSLTTVMTAVSDLRPWTVAVAPAWHWYCPSSSSLTSVICRLHSPETHTASDITHQYIGHQTSDINTDTGTVRRLPV